MQIITPRWPPLIAAVALLLTVSALILISLRQNEGHFVYALDDAYIHLAIARNLAAFGTWGVTRYEFSSSSSSLLWTSLLGIANLIHESVYTPLLLTVIFSLLVLFLSDWILQRMEMEPVRSFIILIALVFLTPLPPLIISGMEHTLQILITIAYVYLAASVVSRESYGKGFQALVGLSLVAPTVRYELISLVAITALLLMFRKRWLAAFAVAAAGALPIVIYGLISIRKGSMWLPNSVLLKSSLPGVGIGDLLKTFYLNSMAAPYLLLLAGVSVALWLWGKKMGRVFWDRQQLLLLYLTAMIFLHLSLAAVGWFYRYDAYLVTLGILINGSILLSLKTHSSSYYRRHTLLFASLSLVVVGALLLLSLRAGRAIRITPRATTNIYEQQYQMGLFLNGYYSGAAIGANDIGAINYLADIRCVDLWGLGTVEVARAKLSGHYTTDQITELAENKKMRIALVYSEWFQDQGGLPASWTKVGQWTTKECVICGFPTVSFYAVRPEEISTLKSNLKSFASSLPSSVIQSGSD